jgi:hypothetical protein
MGTASTTASAAIDKPTNTFFISVQPLNAHLPQPHRLMNPFRNGDLPGGAHTWLECAKSKRVQKTGVTYATYVTYVSYLTYVTYNPFTGTQGWCFWSLRRR